VILLALVFAPLYTFLPACAYWQSRPNVADHTSANQEIGFFPAGTHVRIDVYVYGGNEALTAQVVNIGLDNITKEGLVVNGASIAFEAPKNDHYGLYLRNDFGMYNTAGDKQVLVKVYYYYYNYIIFAVGIMVLVLGVFLILHHALESRTRNR
jgi:hypothetical protein